jgi:hypothetical protein
MLPLAEPPSGSCLEHIDVIHTWILVLAAGYVLTFLSLGAI